MRQNRRLEVIANHLNANNTNDVNLAPVPCGSVDDSDIVIVGYARTPMGSFNGSLSSIPAVNLGAAAIKKAVNHSGFKPSDVDACLMGNVLQGNEGQAPARQAALGAGLGERVVCTTVNKVCASGMKAIIIGAQDISSGSAEIVAAGGMESMSNAPYYLPKVRSGLRMGDSNVVDGLMKDGLTDAYDKHAMGVIAEKTAKEYKIDRKTQDEYAERSYKRAQAAWESDVFKSEIAPVEVTERGLKKVIDQDEGHKKVNLASLPKLKGAFGGDTVTAGNSSTISDGASAVVLTSLKNAKSRKVRPLFRILGWGEAATTPDHFTIAPSLAIPLACKRAGVDIKNIDFFEINEAFSVVAEANCQILNLPKEKVNVYGGAVSLGHPLGSSGSRIVVTLCNVLTQKQGRIGCAAICNGGGGASAIIIERL